MGLKPVVKSITRHLTIELPWPPVTGNHAVKHSRAGGHYKTSEARAYELTVARQVEAARAAFLLPAGAMPGPLAVTWVLAPPDRRSRDCDNVRKVVGDALTRAGLWTDDSNKVLRREVFDWTDPWPGGQILLTLEVQP
jgi:Holliday junction resolvase RusA-like endonuclease